MLNKVTSLLWGLGITVLLVCSNPVFSATPNSSGEVRGQVTVVREQPLPIYANFPGIVTSTNEVQIASRLMGYVHKLLVHEGQRVKKGELLLSLDASDIKGGIAQAKAALVKARSVLMDAKENYQRFQALYQEKAVPEQQFQQVDMGYKVAQGNLAAAQAALRQARAQLRYVDVRAPFAGMVVAKFIDSGQLAAPGRPLLTLQSSGYLQVQVQVSQPAFEKLQLGQQVVVTLDGRDFKPRQVEAIVAQLVAAADPMTHSHSIKLNLSQSSGAISGDFARVRIPIRMRKSIVVPQSAIQRRAGIDGVFVLDGDGLAAFRMVRLGERNEAGVVVLAGLVAGEQIVVSASGELNNGTKVRKAQGDGA